MTGCWKVAHPSRAAANAAARRMKGKHPVDRQRSRAVAYRCMRCGAWHTSSKQRAGVR